MRKADAWRTYDRNGYYVWSETREEAERDFPGKDHQPALVLALEDRQTLLKGAAFIEDYASSAVHCELAKRLREMAGS